MKHYFESLFNENLTFVLGWEAFVLFMLLMFVSIIFRLNRVEKKVDLIQSYLDSILEDLQ
jgi:hypothetical protein